MKREAESSGEDAIDIALRRIQLKCRRPVNELLAGEYPSAFRGRGVEFDEVRPYAPGDEVRSIDWNVTARMGEPYIKRYIEERELRVYIVVDISASKHFGSGDNTKREAAAELAALLAFSAIKNGDRAGLLLFSDAVEHFVPPAKGQTHVLRLIDDLLRFRGQSRGTDIAVALDHIGQVAGRGALVFVISDFQDSGYEDALLSLEQHHEVVALSVSDPGERQLPKVGLARLLDPETWKPVIVDAGHEGSRKSYSDSMEASRAATRAICEDAGADFVEIAVGDDYASHLHGLFLTRGSRSAPGVTHG